jgi:hypothetical protein
MRTNKSLKSYGKQDPKAKVHFNHILPSVLLRIKVCLAELVTVASRPPNVAQYA